MSIILAFLKKHSTIAIISVVVAAIIVPIAARIITQKNAATPTASNIRTIQLVPAKNFRGDLSTVAADGTVESLAQVDVRSQLSAPAAKINYSIGDAVSEGATLMELYSADILSQLNQANAALTLARAQYYSGGVSLESANKAMIDKIRDSYLKADDAVYVQVDQLFTDPTKKDPKLVFKVLDPQLEIDTNSDRMLIGESFPEWKNTVNALSISSNDEEMDDAIAITKKNLALTTKFLNEVSETLNQATPNLPSVSAATIAAWKTMVTVQRATISGAVMNFTGGEAGLAAARASYQSQSGQDGKHSVSAAEAQVMIAEASVSTLKIQLAKTIIRSPIAGKISGIFIKEGELASPGQMVASVVGVNGLAVKAFVSVEDFTRLAEGASVLIDGRVKGTVQKVAPNVGAMNKKVEIKVIVKDAARSGLVIGENVTLAIEAQESKMPSGENRAYVVPIQNVVIVPGDAFVYTVGADSKIKKNPVILGEIKGDFVEIKSGLSDDMSLVSPVYELQEGDTVAVQ
jgi:RND family efflux transporter MFP subunit